MKKVFILRLLCLSVLYILFNFTDKVLNIR